MSTSLSVEHIAKTPGVCGGRACIAGHRIRVMDVVLHHEHGGKTAAEIAAMFPGITVADVYAALAYYHDHPDEIRADLEAHDRAAEYGKTQPSKLKDALASNPALRAEYPVTGEPSGE